MDENKLEKLARVSGKATSQGLDALTRHGLAGLGAKVVVADLNLHSYEEFRGPRHDRRLPGGGNRGDGRRRDRS